MFVYLFYHTDDVEYWNEEDSEIDEDFSPVTHVHDEEPPIYCGPYAW